LRYPITLAQQIMFMLVVRLDQVPLVLYLKKKTDITAFVLLLPITGELSNCMIFIPRFRWRL